jgi:mannose-1-phosphate guanylyltransferase/phosphomannomutase
MNAMILAAGLGTRLGELGRTEPKVLLDVGGKPILKRHLELLEREGIERVVVNAHHLAHRIEQFVDSYDGRLEVVCLVEQSLLGTAGAVRSALLLLEPAPFVVLYGDVLFDESFATLLEMHRRRGAIATIGVHEADSAEGKGVVEVDESGRVTCFVEKTWKAEGTVLVNSGLYVLERDLVACLPEGVASDFGHDVFPAAVAAGKPIYAVGLRSAVIDIGTPEGLARGRSFAEASVARPQRRADA